MLLVFGVSAGLPWKPGHQVVSRKHAHHSTQQPKALMQLL